MELDYRKNPALLAQIIDTMADGVFTVDLGGHFASWSEGAERITGYARDELVGRPCSALEGPGCRGFGKIAEVLAAPGALEGIRDEECRIVAKDGRPLHLLGNLRLIYDEQRRVRGAVGTFTDLSAWLVQQAPAERAPERAPHAVAGFVGRSKPLLEALRRVELAAASTATVLLRGEPGTGKARAARAIHALSAQASGPFVELHVAESAPEHAEGELNAAAQRAAGGTLYLDGVAELAPPVQARLARALEHRELRARLVAGTHRDLEERVRQDLFREDLYFRVRVFEIVMPALRERRVDIPALVQHFVDELAALHGKRVVGVTREALECLVEAPWPGNARELRSALEHALVVVTGERIALLDLPNDVREARELARGSDPSLRLTPQQTAERARIRSALERTRWNRTVAADLLGVSRMTLWKKMKRYGLSNE